MAECKEIETLWRGGKYFYNLEQLLKIVKMSKKRFYKELKKVYKSEGYSSYKKMLEEEILYVGKHTYISSGIYRYLGYWFYIFEISRKMENKRVKEKCKGVIND